MKKFLMTCAGIGLVGVLIAYAATLRTETVKWRFESGIQAFSVTDLSGNTLMGAGANGETVMNGTDGTLTMTRNTAGTVTITAADDDATAGLTMLPGGAAALTLGGGSTTAVTVTTDSTGNAEVVLPNASIGAAEVGNVSLRMAYCGQLAENGTIYFGGLMITNAEPTLADATCDGFDDATEANVDTVLSATLVLYPKYMRCVTNGTLGAAETLTFTLRDDTADVTGVTCSMAVGETTCDVLTPTASAIAAGSAIAVKAVEVSNNADDDAKCIVLFQVQ